jgi:hypothetical protein
LNAQKRALWNDRSRLAARKLAADEPAAAGLRKPAGKGEILAAMRRAPLAELNLTREFDPGRKFDL